MTTESDVIVIGGGLAGLGVATSLAGEFKNSVVVLDKMKPDLDGNDRFKPDIAASFKNAGMFDLGSVVPGIGNYFTQKTAELYGECDITMREDGAYVLAENLFNAISTDVLLENVSPQGFKSAEPDVELAKPTTAVFKFSKGSQAEPEVTMQHLIEKAQSIDGVELMYGEGVTSVSFQGSTWTVNSTSGKVYTAGRLVIAAGPGSKALLKSLGLKLPVSDVYGLIAQSQELESTWLKGSILGAKSYVFWLWRTICACGRNTLEATSWFGESKSWTTHLYINVHNNRIYLGGPRIALPETYDESQLTPAKYFSQIVETEEYAKNLVKFPEGTKFEVAETWGGIMAFPSDKDMPFVGPVAGKFNNTLFLNTGFASAGFRQAYGAGHFLACLMEEGEEKLRDRVGKPDVHDFESVMPGSRVK